MTSLPNFEIFQSAGWALREYAALFELEGPLQRCKWTVYQVLGNCMKFQVTILRTFAQRGLKIGVTVTA